MLSRTAENLFWSARYIERADSLARLLEVGYRISLIPNTERGYTNEWESILETSGIKNEYLKNILRFSSKEISSTATSSSTGILYFSLYIFSVESMKSLIVDISTLISFFAGNDLANFIKSDFVKRFSS